MATKIFLLGRPGSGKSFAAVTIVEHSQTKGQLVIHRSDYAILQEMHHIEQKALYADETRRKIVATANSGFEVRDLEMLDLALKDLEKNILAQIKSTPSNTLALIEFARNDYQRAMRQFHKTFLRGAYFLFVEAELSTCIARVSHRITALSGYENHYVSESVLRDYYKDDGKQYIISAFKTDHHIPKRRVKVLENNGSKEQFAEQVRQFADFVVQRQTR